MNDKERVEAAKAAVTAGSFTPGKKTKSELLGQEIGLKMKAWTEEQNRKEAERKAACITPRQKANHVLEQIFGVLIIVLCLYGVGRAIFVPQSCGEYRASVEETMGETVDSKEEIEYAARAIQGRRECF